MIPPGLLIQPEYVTEAEEAACLRLLHSYLPAAPNGDQRARLLRYGERPAVREGRVRRQYAEHERDLWEPEIPAPFRAIAHRMEAEGVVSAPVRLVVVNEYQRGQWVRPHVDIQDAGAEIVVLGLGGAVTFAMQRGERVFAFPFLRRMLVVMTGAARTGWRHWTEPAPAERFGVVFRQLGG